MIRAASSLILWPNRITELIADDANYASVLPIPTDIAFDASLEDSAAEGPIVTRQPAFTAQ